MLIIKFIILVLGFSLFIYAYESGRNMHKVMELKKKYFIKAVCVFVWLSIIAISMTLVRIGILI